MTNPSDPPRGPLAKLDAALTPYLQCAVLLLIRIPIGWQFFVTGKGKLQNLEQTTGFFQNLGIPAPELNARIAGATECFGGLLLLAGLGARPAALLLSFTMCVAYATAHWSDVHGIGDFIKQPPFPFLVVSLVVLAFGPGAVSLDKLIERMRRR